MQKTLRQHGSGVRSVKQKAAKLAPAKNFIGGSERQQLSKVNTDDCQK